MHEENRICDWLEATPATQAQNDQHHALAIDLLREAASFFLVVGIETEADGEKGVTYKVIGGGHTYRAAFDCLLRIASSEAVGMWVKGGFADEALDEEGS